jgi:hypothetical protein
MSEGNLDIIDLDDLSERLLIMESTNQDLVKPNLSKVDLEVVLIT